MATLTKKEKEQEKEYAKERLLSYYLKEGQTVYVLQRSVSSSGMSRNLNLFTVNNGKIEEITYYTAHALGWRLVEKDGHRSLRVEGTGMDMGFHTVESLSFALFGLEGRNALRYERL
jgi:hypothetical protein